MDTLFAPIYDTEWGATIDPTHERFVRKVIQLTPESGAVLDAACGTGKYWPLLSGRRLVGTDQSAEMLAQAHAKRPDVPLAKVGLQELAFEVAFDGVVCIDAMENVPPEDWPLVLRNLRRALRPRGVLYLTAELADPAELAQAQAEGRSLGLPLVDGEVGHEGYHYYPSMPQVRAWIEEASLAIREDAVGDGYHHFLCSATEAG
jgi:SAM-dependent methyltransferase